MFTLGDLRLHIQTPFTAIHVGTGYRNTVGHEKVASYRKFAPLKRASDFIWSKIAQTERETETERQRQRESTAFLTQNLV